MIVRFRNHEITFIFINDTSLVGYKRLVPVTFSSSKVSLFVNFNACDDLPFFLKDRIDLH